MLFNIGLTEKALYRYADASRTLERYLIEGNQGGAKLTAERRQQVVQLIEEMKSLLAPLRFVLTPASARVTVDGRPMTVASDGVAGAGRRQPRGRRGRRRLRVPAARR